MTLNLEEVKNNNNYQAALQKLYNFFSYSRLEQVQSFCFYLVKAGSEILRFLAVPGSSC